MHAKLLGGGGAWPDNEPMHPPQTHFAHNFPRSLLEIARKRCNPNDMNSMFEVLAGELRAKLMGEQPVRQRAERSSQRGRLAGGPPPTGASSSPARQTTRSRPTPLGSGGMHVRRQLSKIAAQPTLHVAPSRPSATVMPAAARRSRSSSARAQSLAARASARSESTA